MTSSAKRATLCAGTAENTDVSLSKQPGRLLPTAKDEEMSEKVVSSATDVNV